MKTYTETNFGELVAISNGVLSCQNLQRNWDTIGEWMTQHDEDFKATIKVDGSLIMVELPDSTPVPTIGSLLEAFEYQ
jgi:hypothetical protein